MMFRILAAFAVFLQAVSATSVSLDPNWYVPSKKRKSYFEKNSQNQELGDEGECTAGRAGGVKATSGVTILCWQTCCWILELWLNTFTFLKAQNQDFNLCHYADSLQLKNN